VGYQLLATVITWVLAAVGSFILLKLVDLTVGLRVTSEDEFEGLDLTQHGEAGYHLEEGSEATLAEEFPARHTQTAGAHAPAVGSVIA